MNKDNINNGSNQEQTEPTKIIGEYSSGEYNKPPKIEVTDIKSSLLDKCMPYVIDEDGTDTSIDSKPLYELQTVADILKEQSEKSMDALSKKYDMIFEDLSIDKKNKSKKETTKKKEENNTQPVSKTIKNVQSNVSFVISDIDSTTITPTKDMSTTATITFTPVKTDDTVKKINVTTNTKEIDLTNELVKLPETVTEENETVHSLEKSEFEEFVPENELETEKDFFKLKRLYAISRRSDFFATFISFLITGILSIGKIPFFTQFTVAYTSKSMTVCSVLALIVILSNYKMFSSVKDIIEKKNTVDILPVIASIVTIPLAVFSIIESFDVLDILILLSFILSIRSMFSFLKSQYIFNILKYTSAPQQKHALKLISDPAITFSMARNAIEGDTMIATKQDYKKITDIMKFTTYQKTLNGNISFIAVFSVILSIILGIASSIYFDGFINGLYTATAIQCFASIPCLFFIDTLPLYTASKKLLKSGAVILGKSGAEQIEQANAFVINSSDIFPAGTVTLHKMQILSENSLDDTLIRAAALTEYTGNTLAPIFKSIAKSGNISILPDTDTVKYEERLGISGWVDNRLLFIGNRTLMETHGIKVPSIDVDRKILANGYFPVYVATREKACALLIIQYSVDPKIAKELRKITNIGVTMLVNNTDPNLTEEMLCDYIGLYEDSVKVMSSAGSYMYKNATVPVDTVSAPAIFKNNPLALPRILNCATKIKRSNILLTVAYIICACLGAIVFAYTSFGGSGEPLSQTVTLLYCICSTIISYLIYLFDRP